VPDQSKNAAWVIPAVFYARIIFYSFDYHKKVFYICWKLKMNRIKIHQENKEESIKLEIKDFEPVKVDDFPF
jgi:hypothetical protein